MLPTLKAEFKKIFTVRSTYGWLLLALIIAGIYGFYGEGFNDAANLLKAKTDAGASLFIAATVQMMSNFIGLFGGIVALLLITHEYRHGTIVYTLTASNSRTKVLGSKIIAIMGYVFVYSLALTAFGLGMIHLGLAFSHHVLPPQSINYFTYFGKVLFYSEAYALAALLFGTVIRNQVGALAALLIVPGPVEALLSLLLKTNAVYLPFMALQEVVHTPLLPGAHPAHPDNKTGSLTPLHGAEVFLVYLVIGWLITWYLFLRRDAN